MAKNIRTLVAALVVPFAFGAGAAHAYTGNCAASLNAAAAEISDVGNYEKTRNTQTNIDALNTKLAGVSGKVNEYPPKTGDALLIVADMLQKVSDWVEAAKPKLTTYGAEDIRRVLTGTDPAQTPESVAECIKGL